MVNLSHRRHVVPLDKNVVQLLPLQEIKVFFVKVVGIANLNRIWDIPGALPDKRAELFNKMILGGHFLFIEILKLKHQHTNVSFQRGNPVVEFFKNSCG